MRHFFCRFGVHNWTVWSDVEFTYSPIQHKKCVWCGKIRSRVIVDEYVG